jgi:hypothetical protein
MEHAVAIAVVVMVGLVAVTAVWQVLAIGKAGALQQGARTDRDAEG